MGDCPLIAVGDPWWIKWLLYHIPVAQLHKYLVCLISFHNKQALRQLH